MTTFLKLSLALSLVVAGCSNASSEDSVATEPADFETTGTQSEPEGAEETTTSLEQAGADASSEIWDGEEAELFAQKGENFIVVGVAYNDLLNLRATPSASAEILLGARPTGDELTSTGRTWEVSGSYWYEVEFRGETGWINSRFVAYEGLTFDETSDVVAANDGELPAAETLIDLADFVSQQFVSQDVQSEVIQVSEVEIGDLYTVTYDVIGLADDAAKGSRLQVFGVEDESGEAIVLKSVEVTDLCLRGAGDQGCV